MNGRFIKVFHISLVLFSLAVLLASCDIVGDNNSLVISADTYTLEPGDKIDAQMLVDLFVANTEATDTAIADTDVPVADTGKEDDTSQTEENADTVYWVKGGEVWHTRSNCSSLSRSKNILSGTVEDALLAGKARVCKRCGS